MNILFFLKPKDEVEYLETDFTIRQALEKIDNHGYSAIPVLDLDGCYVDTISDGDILMYIKNHGDLNLRKVEDISIKEISVRRSNKSISINSNMEDLLDLSLNQNFVPVVDDLNHFIGIITRKDIIKYFYEKNGL